MPINLPFFGAVPAFLLISVAAPSPLLALLVAAEIAPDAALNPSVLISAEKLLKVLGANVAIFQPVDPPFFSDLRLGQFHINFPPLALCFVILLY